MTQYLVQAIPLDWVRVLRGFNVGQIHLLDSLSSRSNISVLLDDLHDLLHRIGPNQDSSGRARG